MLNFHAIGDVRFRINQPAKTFSFLRFRNERDVYDPLRALHPVRFQESTKLACLRKDEGKWDARHP